MLDASADIPREEADDRQASAVAVVYRHHHGPFPRLPEAL